MRVYKSDFLNQAKCKEGFIGAIVCEFGDPDDATMITKLQKAYNDGGTVCIKGQWFTVGGIDVSEFFGTILFGLMQCKNVTQENPPNNSL